MGQEVISSNIDKITGFQDVLDNSLLKKLFELEDRKEGKRHYNALKEQFFRGLGFEDAENKEVLKEMVELKGKLGLGEKVDILLYSNKSDKKVVVLVEYKKVLSGELNVRIKGKLMFLGKKISWKREEVDSVIESCLKGELDKEKVDEFKSKRSSEKEETKGFWLHKDGSGVGQVLNYYLIYQYLRKLSSKESQLKIFAILTNGIEWILFNYSLEEIAKIFREGFSEEIIKRDKINFFDISEWNNLTKAIKSLAKGSFHEREESKRVYILP